MATIVLKDGRRIPLVRPTAWDGCAIQDETGWNAKKFANIMAHASAASVQALYASLRRAGVKHESGKDVLFIDGMNDNGYPDLIENVVASPGDLARADEGEDEQEPDPQ